MKEHLAQLVRAAPTPAQARNITREYLQARILAALQRAGAMIPLAFHGGTALRFLYNSQRYSEDLDFALERAQTAYDFRAAAVRPFIQSYARNETDCGGFCLFYRVGTESTSHSYSPRNGWGYYPD